MRYAFRLLLPLLLLAAGSSSAGVPRLLKDVDPNFVLASSNPRFLGTVDGRAILSATGGLGDEEPFVADGTFSGTRALGDLCPGGCGSYPRPFGQSRRAVFFTATPRSGEVELWATDGTRAGTARIGDSFRTYRIWDSFFGSDQPIVQTGDRLYFIAADSLGGEELRVSDGTPVGTFALAHFQSAPNGSAIYGITPLGAGAVFLAPGAAGAELWATDGTPAGTRRLRPLPGSSDPESPMQLFQAGPFVYFTATVGRLGRELWRTDGTQAGTVNVADLVRGSRSVEVEAGAALGSRFLFVATTPQAGSELWVTDGTAGGTRVLSRYGPRTPFGDAAQLPVLGRLPGADLGSKVLFAADDGVHGRELWVTDGTSAGTSLLRDIHPGETESRFLPLTDGDGTGGRRSYFLADDGAHGRELWSSDGTTAGTRMVRDLCRGTCSSSIFRALAVGTSLLFSNDPTEGERPGGELWRTDGTPPGTFRLSFDGPSSFVFQMVALGGVALFTNSDLSSGRELWRTDLSRAGTVLLSDLAQELIGSSSRIARFMTLGSDSLFLRRNADGSFDLWRSDGGESGTRKVASLGGGELGDAWGEANGRTFFVLDQGLWRTDGTAAGTLRLSPAGTSFPHDAPDGPVYVVAAGGLVYFPLIDAEHGFELWASDGSPAGTRLVRDFVPGPDGSLPLHASAVGSLLCFTICVPGSGRELWRTDGTDAGTFRIRQLGEPTGSRLDASVRLGAYLYFSPDETFQELWRTDGTVSGTQRVLSTGDLSPWALWINPEGVIDGRLRLHVNSGIQEVGGTYLSDGTIAGTKRVVADDPEVSEMAGLDGRLLWPSGPRGELWVSEGTFASARPLLDRNGEPVQFITFLGRLGDKELMTTFDGRELWETDGTPAGTRSIEPLLPGLGLPRAFVIVGGKAYFLAGDDLHGFEPWVLAAD